jgi:hypothetical protein
MPSLTSGSGVQSPTLGPPSTNCAATGLLRPSHLRSPTRRPEPLGCEGYRLGMACGAKWIDGARRDATYLDGQIECGTAF